MVKMPSSWRGFFVNYEEPLDGIDTPSDYRYIKIVRSLLLFINSWPRKEIGESEPYYQSLIHNYLVLIISIVGVFGSVFYVYLHSSELSFMEVGNMYIIVLMSSTGLFRVATLTLSIKYRNVVKQFLTEMHLFFYKDRSEYAMKTHKMIHMVSHLFTVYLVGQMFIGCILFHLMPMYNNYAAGKYKSGGLQNSSFEHSLYYSYPFDVSTNVKGYIIGNIINWFMAYLCSTCFCIFDLILSLMIFHLWGHFKILINSLNEFPRPSSDSKFSLENGYVIQAEKYTKEELLEVSERLKECITYHREILSFTDTISDVFGPMLFIYYAFHQASGCLLLLECSQMTAPVLMRYLPLTIILTQQLIQLSVIFELVGSESGKLKDAVYGVPWECMDSSNRRVVTFFLMNVQEPVHLKAGGVADVGVTSMAMILKTSVSYFTFLRSM